LTENTRFWFFLAGVVMVGISGVLMLAWLLGVV